MALIQVVPEGSTGAYTPYGGGLKFIKNKDHQVFICGSADSGKTTACCYKLHLLCLLYPGCRVAMLRKSYRALINSTVQTFNRVLGETGYNKQVRVVGGTKPEQYIYPHARNEVNGRVYEGESVIVLGNLDKSSDHLGAEYDFIYVSQPEDATLEDWEYLATRANGRRGGSPYPQMFGDPNPAEATHWIKTGADEGKWTLITSNFTDNPTVWDMKLNKPTPGGEKRIAVLRNLTGARRKRLYEGEWVSREGLIYGDVWDATVHQCDRFEIPDDWKRYWAIDFGFDHPFVWECFAESPNGTLFRYRYIYMTGRTTEQNAQRIKNMTMGEPMPLAVLTDRDPENQVVLENVLNCRTIAANKSPGSIESGINTLTEVLRFDKDKKPGIFFMRDSLVEVDQRLKRLRKPIGFEEEVMGYQWNPKTMEKGKPLPFDRDNHSLDAVRYLISYLKGSKRKVPAVLWG